MNSFPEYTQLRSDEEGDRYLFRCDGNDILQILTIEGVTLDVTQKTWDNVGREKPRSILQICFDANFSIRLIILDAVELIQRGCVRDAELLLTSVIRSVPNRWDAAIELADLYRNTDQTDRALSIYQRIWELGESIIPDDFNPKKHIFYVSRYGTAPDPNYPFLWAGYQLALSSIKDDDDKKAISLLLRNIELDCNDSMGCSSLLTDLYLDNGYYSRITKLAKSYKGCCYDNLLIASILSAFKLKDIKLAMSQLEAMVSYFPEFFNLLDFLNEDNEFVLPVKESSSRFDYAINFWGKYLECWLQVPGSVEFLTLPPPGDSGKAGSRVDSSRGGKPTRANLFAYNILNHDGGH